MEKLEGRLVTRAKYVYLYVVKNIGRARRERKLKFSEKDRSCLTKNNYMPLACEPLGERETRPGARFSCRAENPGIPKDEEELRLDSWIQIKINRKRLKESEEVHHF